ncbi:MAG: KipI antagonist [Thermodesulfobium narugense]|nr:MAG: KipI antagonist [Thermodesulfobium narugense]
MKLLVKKPGLFSSIQDFGRKSYQKYGISQSGALDEYAFILANMLVGNDEKEAVLELTLLGAEFEVLEGGTISITGADMSAKINNKTVSMWETIELSKGDTLTFELAKKGCRTYIALGGGIDLIPILGSRSTYLRAKLGGLNGDIIKEGDVIRSKTCLHKNKYRLPEEFIPKYSKDNIIRVILGPQLNYFTKKGIKTFLNEKFIYTNDINRMACRLDGPSIEHKLNANIISDGTPNGAIQVPADGKPIILLNDRQTTGGYPKIACVVTVDIQKIAQAQPNDTLSFKPISIIKAHLLYKNYLNNLTQIRKILNLLSG